MTTIVSTTATVERTKGISHVTNGRVALGVEQIVVAAAFLMSGGAIFASAPTVVAVFNAIGGGRWSAISPARWKWWGALSLFVPTLAPCGAILLAATMIRAVASHVPIVGGLALSALVLLAAMVAIAWARREQLAPRAE